MTDRPHTFVVRSSDNRRLAAHLIGQAHTTAVVVEDDRLVVSTADFGTFTGTIARASREAGVTLEELRPLDESLESVFAYLVSR